MSISTPFIQRPIATSLLLVALTLAGGIAYTLLPVSALPEVDFPTITVSANLPGASPEVMAASVAGTSRPPRSTPRRRASHAPARPKYR